MQFRMYYMVHFIGLSGLRGRASCYTEAHSSFDSAVADLATRFALGITQLEELSIDGRIGLDIEYQHSEYLEILECDCVRIEHHGTLS